MSAPVPEAVRSFAPEENPFETVMVDVTHRCQMACANCYVPNRDIPDMDIARLEACLAALPERVNLRLIGAEPTKGEWAPDSRLFPETLSARTGRGLWFKLIDWQANVEGRVPPDLRRRGRVTQDFRIAPLVEHVKANEGRY